MLQTDHNGRSGSREGLGSSGIVGPKTWKALLERWAAPRPLPLACEQPAVPPPGEMAGFLLWPVQRARVDLQGKAMLLRAGGDEHTWRDLSSQSPQARWRRRWSIWPGLRSWPAD